MTPEFAPLQPELTAPIDPAVSTQIARTRLVIAHALEVNRSNASETQCVLQSELQQAEQDKEARAAEILAAYHEATAQNNANYIERVDSAQAVHATKSQQQHEIDHLLSMQAGSLESFAQSLASEINKLGTLRADKATAEDDLQQNQSNQEAVGASMIETTADITDATSKIAELQLVVDKDENDFNVIGESLKDMQKSSGDLGAAAQLAETIRDKQAADQTRLNTARQDKLQLERLYSEHMQSYASYAAPIAALRAAIVQFDQLIADCERNIVVITDRITKIDEAVQKMSIDGTELAPIDESPMYVSGEVTPLETPDVSRGNIVDIVVARHGYTIKPIPTEGAAS